MKDWKLDSFDLSFQIDSKHSQQYLSLCSPRLILIHSIEILFQIIYNLTQSTLWIVMQLRVIFYRSFTLMISMIYSHISKNPKAVQPIFNLSSHNTVILIHKIPLLYSLVMHSHQPFSPVSTKAKI